MNLDLDRTLFIGLPSPEASVRKSTFFDSFDIDQFNLIIWYAQSFADEIARLGINFSGVNHSYGTVKKIYETKMSEIIRWIADGHTFIIFPHVFPGINVPNSQEYLNRLPPWDEIDLQISSGELLIATDGVEDLLGAFSNLLRYDLLITGKGRHTDLQNIQHFKRTVSSSWRGGPVRQRRRIFLMLRRCPNTAATESRVPRISSRSTSSTAAPICW